ncbi:MAG: hypothetical protein WCQ82_01080 [Bacteroidaceae bacterium]|nr:hypothetical protein [Bacteroidaceae bacterium]
MLGYILTILLILGLCVGLLGIKIFFGKGRFKISHVSSSKELRKRGIGCAQSQDRDARSAKKWKVNVHKNS